MKEMAQIKSWTVSDIFWSKIEPLIPIRERSHGKIYRRKPGAGRKPMDSRQIFSAIVYVLRTGCQWKALPREYGSSSAIHAHFQRWQRSGLFLKIWQAGLAEYDEREGIAWRWQSIDGAMGKAPLAREAVGANPTDRGKNRRKRSLLVDARGIPLSLVVSGANTHDVKLLPSTLEAIVTARPKPRKWKPQHLCADAGYKGKPAKHVVTEKDYRPHIKQRKDEAADKRNKPGYKARRWVVERTHSWMNRFRKLLVSFEKTKESYLALLHLAAAMVCWRQTIAIHG